MGGGEKIEVGEWKGTLWEAREQIDQCDKTNPVFPHGCNRNIEIYPI